MKISRGDSLDRFYLVKLFGYGIFLHKIHHSDPEGLYHNHPWNGLSIIFGRYTEYWRQYSAPFARRWFNRIHAQQFHRIVIDRPVWTLFFHGRKYNKWAITDPAHNTVSVPWDGEVGHKSYAASMQNNPQPLTP